MKNGSLNQPNVAWILFGALFIAAALIVFQLMPSDVGTMVAPDRPLL